MTDGAGVRAAAERARGPQPLWALVPAPGRARYLRRAGQAVLDELEPLAGMLAVHGGIPRTEALLAELLPSAGGLRQLADEGPDALADRRLGRTPLLRAGRRSLLLQAPYGVVGICAGGASPWAEPALETAAALLAGNGVVLAAPWAGQLAEVLARAGVPGELVQPVDAASADLRAACDHLVEIEPDSPKAAMIVLPGAPLSRTVAGALWAAFGRSGRGAGAVGRIVVVREMAEPLLERLLAGARRLRAGDPAAPETEIGPLRSADELERVRAIVEEAVAAGAELLCGGPTGELLYAPAVLRGVPAEARLLREPVPGPVVAVVEAADEDDAVELAGGAGAVSVWAGDRAQGERVARTLPAAQVWVNDHGPTAPAAPVRLARYTVPRHLATQPPLLRSARWLPYDPVLVQAATAATRLLNGRESERVRRLREGAVPLTRVALRLARDATRR